MKLADIQPTQRGIPFRQWRAADLDKQSAEYRASLKREDAPITKQRQWSPRDSYGMKSI